MNNSSKLAVLVDGSGYIYRAFYALPQFSFNEQPLGAVYGFCSMLIPLIAQHKSDVFCVALDGGRDTFRSKIYSEYKSNRKETPEELKLQFPLLKDACLAFGIPIAEKMGVEADDIIATYAQKLSSLQYEVRIISSDKDLMQLISKKISMFDPIKSKIIKSEEVLAKYSVYPEKMAQLQALMGDSTDNIPGISGIGPKTAAKLINEYGSLENIYKNIDAIKQHKLRENLINQKEILDTSLQLVTLKNDVEVNEDYDALRLDYQYSTAEEFLKKYNFTSLIKRLEKNTTSSSANKRNHISISSINQLKNFFELNRIQKFSFFCSCCSHENGAIAFCSDEQTAVCVFSFSSNTDLFNDHINFLEICDLLKYYFENPSIKKIGIHHNLAYFKNINFKNYDDIALMSYLLNGVPSNYLENTFAVINPSLAKMTFQNVCQPDHICAISELIFDNYDNLLGELHDNQLLNIYEQIDRPLINILKQMENNGIALSTQVLSDLGKILSQQISKIEKEIFQITDCEFNIGSVKQLSDVLFQKLKIPNSQKITSLDVEHLEALASYSSVPSLVIEWRKLSKLLNGYVNSLDKFINLSSNRLHSTFHMTSTVTGRLSSSNPNLQNIPKRTENGLALRRAFISSENCKLLSFDYSQIELRILSHMADIKLLKEAFISKQDVHAATAASLFDVNLQQVTSEMRSHAKTINFGIIYGMSHFKLSKIFKISQKDANEFIQNYFAKIPEFKIFKENALDAARKNGYVKTIVGRKCYIKDIASNNYHLRSFSERQAINAIIQGSAADIVKIAMINCAPLLETIHSKMLLQIHDELVFETENTFVELAINEIKKSMENAYALSIPLELHINYDNYLK